MISEKTSERLRLIRKAGVGRVKKTALRLGVKTVERDMKILRDIANGSVPQAAERSRVSEALARRVLARYAEIAESVIARDKRSGRGSDAPGSEQ